VSHIPKTSAILGRISPLGVAVPIEAVVRDVPTQTVVGWLLSKERDPVELK
jgi:hypothetical protein